MLGKTKVRRLKNISNYDLSIKIGPQTVVYLKPGQEIKEQNVYNMDELSGFVSASYSLNEIPLLQENRYLKG